MTPDRASGAPAGEKAADSPRSTWERITPEFPRAPINEPWAMAEATASMSASPSRASRSAHTESTVIVMFEPVSPSGTG